MQARRRSALLPALAILSVAGLLAACGVKGDLEPPPSYAAPAGQQSAAPAGTESASASNKVFLEQSSVRGGRPESVIPEMPPREWRKDRVYQPEQERKPASQSLSRPDKPFALDWLL